MLFLGIPGPEDFGRGEIIGYASIVLSMVFVFLGIRQYRDVERGGQLKFWEAVKIGLAIAAFPAVAFGIYNLIYTYVIDPDFLTKFYDYSLSTGSVGKSAEEIEVLKQEIQAQQEMFRKSGYAVFYDVSDGFYNWGYCVYHFGIYIKEKRKLILLKKSCYEVYLFCCHPSAKR